MTAFAMQEDLVQELKKLFSEFRISKKQELKKINVFVQDIPFSQNKKDMEEIFPYIIVRLEEGGISNDKNSCQVVLVFGVCDNDVNRQGYKDLLNMMQEVLYHYATEKIIAQRYSIGNDMEWLIQDGDNLFPYYIGAITFEVELPVIRVFDDNI